MILLLLIVAALSVGVFSIYKHLQEHPPTSVVGKTVRYAATAYLIIFAIAVAITLLVVLGGIIFEVASNVF